MSLYIVLSGFILGWITKSYFHLQSKATNVVWARRKLFCVYGWIDVYMHTIVLLPIWGPLAALKWQPVVKHSSQTGARGCVHYFLSMSTVTSCSSTTLAQVRFSRWCLCCFWGWEGWGLHRLWLCCFRLTVGRVLVLRGDVGGRRVRLAHLHRELW